MTPFDRIELGRKAKELGFVRDTFEKVCRLVDVLSFMEQDEHLRDSLALKGGTAINLTIFELPRLSVDIDLDYSRDLPRADMLNDRSVLTDHVKKHMAANGYVLSDRSKQYHALDSFVFAYPNSGGVQDNIKIEINYMLRSHILEPNRCIVHLPWLEQELTVLRVDPVEIFASKIVALLNRSTPRDLYDLNNLLASDLLHSMDPSLLRKCVVFYMAIGSDFVLQDPDFDGIRHITQNRIKADLVPVLRSGVFFDVQKAQNVCIPYLRDLLTLSEDERLFLSAFQEKRYCPELLFESREILERIGNHPMALWKCSERDR